MINLVQNKSNQYVAPAVESTQSAIADFGTDLGDKLALSIVDGPGANSYPIAGYTYLLLYMDQQDCAKAQKLVEFMNWAYGPDGTKDASDLSYVPLPDAVKHRCRPRWVRSPARVRRLASNQTINLPLNARLLPAGSCRERLACLSSRNVE